MTVLPTVGSPTIKGSAVFAGGLPLAATVSVRFDEVVLAPTKFVAVTSARILNPTSAPTRG